jgi:hypothetical protein
MLGGWCSNLLDRLGLHYWTAPGSVRGVVDFIRVGGARYNVADLFIVGFHAAVPAGRRLSGPGRGGPADHGRGRAARHRPRAMASMLALAGVCLAVVAVALGAANYGGVKAAPARVSAKGDGSTRSVVAA